MQTPFYYYYVVLCCEELNSVYCWYYSGGIYFDIYYFAVYHPLTFRLKLYSCNRISKS